MRAQLRDPKSLLGLCLTLNLHTDEGEHIGALKPVAA